MRNERGGVPGVWVFHRGALGDSVLAWPLLRAMHASHEPVTFVTDASKAALAARWLGVRGVSAERREFVDLWSGEAGAEIDAEAGLVLHLASRRGVGGRDADGAGLVRWLAGAQRAFPAARIVIEREVLDRRGAAVLAERYGGGPARDEWMWGDESARRDDGNARVVVHVGAGSRAKRWDLERWAELVRHARRGGRDVRVLAGEVEDEQFSARERGLFAELGGEFVRTLERLEQELGGAAVFVGCDSGPGHLAAQLGVPTLALFGPTDHEAWAPIGRCVRVVAPGELSRNMEWLGAEVVLGELGRLLGGRCDGGGEG